MAGMVWCGPVRDKDQELRFLLMTSCTTLPFTRYTSRLAEEEDITNVDHDIHASRAHSTLPAIFYAYDEHSVRPGLEPPDHAYEECLHSNIQQPRQPALKRPWTSGLAGTPRLRPSHEVGDTSKHSSSMQSRGRSCP